MLRAITYTGAFGVQEFAVSDGRGVIKVDPALAPLPTYLGALGLTGLTAYFGLLDVGRPGEGETVVVSAAAGAVGSVAGQIAKLKGCRVIGIAGGQEKCRWIVDELGFDAAIDYKAQDVRGALREQAPDRVEVFFDNVGGEILDAVLTRLARGARIVICGAVSQYNAQRMQGPANYLALIPARASMTGMVIFDYADRHPQATAELAPLAAGRQTGLARLCRRGRRGRLSRCAAQVVRGREHREAHPGSMNTLWVVESGGRGQGFRLAELTTWPTSLPATDRG